MESAGPIAVFLLLVSTCFFVLKAFSSIRKQSRHKIDYLLILRGFAAVAVMLRHLPLRLPSFLPGLDLSWIVDPFGYIPVLVFFTLSGYLTVKTFLNGKYDVSNIKSLSYYYRNRFLRIVPLYYTSIIVCIFIYPEVFHAVPATVGKLFFFIMDYKNPRSIIFNIAYWIMPIEIIFYLAAPMIVVCLKKAVKKIGGLFLLLCLILSYLAYSFYLFSEFPYVAGGVILSRSQWNNLAHCCFIYNLEAFLLGALINFVLYSPKVRTACLKRSARIIMKCIFVIGMPALIARGYYIGDYMFRKGMMDPFTLYGLVPAVGIMIGILALLQDTSINDFKQSFSKRILYMLEWLGIFSYGIYIWNIPVAAALSQLQKSEILPGEDTALSLFTICITIILSAFTYFTIEKPMMKFRTHGIKYEKPKKDN